MNLLVEVAIQENARAVSGSFYIVKNNHVCGPWANVIDGPFKFFQICIVVEQYILHGHVVVILALRVTVQRTPAIKRVIRPRSRAFMSAQRAVIDVYIPYFLVIRIGSLGSPWNKHGSETAIQEAVANGDRIVGIVLTGFRRVEELSATIVVYGIEKHCVVACIIHTTVNDKPLAAVYAKAVARYVSGVFLGYVADIHVLIINKQHVPCAASHKRNVGNIYFLAVVKAYWHLLNAILLPDGQCGVADKHKRVALFAAYVVHADDAAARYTQVVTIAGLNQRTVHRAIGCAPNQSVNIYHMSVRNLVEAALMHGNCLV